jgi:dihydroorotate dehydrogenase electron transfer subunit
VQRWGGGEDERPFLPRAVAPVAGDDGRLVFVLHDVGPGTHRLEELRAGEELWLTGPLGQGFTPGPGTPILVAGGIGVPPVASWLPHAPGAVVLAGFRDEHHAELASMLPGARIATDDGSLGHDGYVTELLREVLDEHPSATVYACGPPLMLEAVRAMCVERGVGAQLALESPMACGFGACFGCVVPLAGGGYARTCVDGPVMEAAALAEVPA